MFTNNTIQNTDRVKFKRAFRAVFIKKAELSQMSYFAKTCAITKTNTKTKQTKYATLAAKSQEGHLLIRLLIQGIHPIKDT